MRSTVRRLQCIRFFGGFVCCVALSQTAALPAKWQGTWVLDMVENFVKKERTGGADFNPQTQE